MIEIAFSGRGLPERYAQIMWARANGVPLILGWTFENGTRYRGTRWMMLRYATDQYTKFGTPRRLGGILFVRDRDAALWMMRWGNMA